MYLEFFNFSEKPFSLTPDSKFLFLTKQFETALEILRYSVTERLGFSVLSGEVGTGKTTITREFLNQLDDSVEYALLVNPMMSIGELLRAINKDFGIPVKNNSPERLLESLNKFLIKQYEKGKNSLLIIDEAQNLSFESLEMIRMLSNIETSKAKLLQIILVGQPELMVKLKSYKVRQLNQRITMRCKLNSLSMIETVRYINHRIVLAGGMNKVFFDPKVYKVIFKYTKGYPRLINILCDRILMAAFVASTGTISQNVVRKAVKDLQWENGRVSWINPLFKLKDKIRSVLN